MGRTLDTLREAASRAGAGDITFDAAAIAYYALVTLVPTLVLVFAVSTALRGGAVADRLIAAADDLLSPAGQQLVREAVLGASGRLETIGIGVLVGLWGGLKLFRALDVAFDRAYGDRETASLVGQTRDAALALGGFLLAVVAVVVGGRVVGDALPNVVVTTLLRFVVLVVLLFPLYYVLPSESRLRDALPGTVVAAGGWLVLRTAFDVYVAVAASYLYGFFGALVLLLTLLYAASFLLLFGAVVNGVLGAAEE